MSTTTACVRDLLSPPVATLLATLTSPSAPDGSLPRRAPLLRPLLASRVPWPPARAVLICRAAELRAALPAWLDAPAHSLPPLRLAYVLSTVPLPVAGALARAAFLACRQIWLADFLPAERNLGLPAALCCRLLPGLWPLGSCSAPGRQWLERGGLEGCLYAADLHAAARRTLLGGAALLVSCQPC